MRPSIRYAVLPALLCSAPLVARAGNPFSLTVDAPAARVGAAAQVRVKVAAAAGYHVNKEYPTSLKLTAPAGIEMPKATMTAKDGAKIETQAASFEIGYTAREAGKKVVTGTVSFAVCSETTCDPHREKLSFTIDVK